MYLYMIVSVYVVYNKLYWLCSSVYPHCFAVGYQYAQHVGMISDMYLNMIVSVYVVYNKLYWLCSSVNQHCPGHTVA